GALDRHSPASPETTTPAPSPSTRASEHPRVGGEDSVVRSSSVRGCGTPPRRRGGRHERLPRDRGPRNTPASAGRTTTGRPARPRSSEHPRVGGEDVSNLVGSASSSGTPPRRRGGRDDLSGEPRRLRNTPASAGRTTAPPPRTSPTAEHPRVGGEDVGDLPFEAADDGTPPRRRGGRGQGRVAADGPRNTPASAGRTATWERPRSRSSEHPRVGGEDCCTATRPPRSRGTPPRRRGGRQIGRASCRDRVGIGGGA